MVSQDGVWRQERAGEGLPDLEWSFEGGRLAALRSGDRTIRDADPAFDLLDLTVDAPTGQLFPPHFIHEPDSGRALERRSGAGSPFSSPYLAPDGLPDLGLGGLAPIAETRTTLSMPAGIVAVFSGGTPTTLFCVTSQGVLFFQRRDGDWVELDRLAPPGLPSSAFSILGFSFGFAGVFGDRLVVCELGGSLPQIALHSRSLPGGAPCGSPALIENGNVAFPVLNGDGVAVDVFRPLDRSWTRMEAHGKADGSDPVFSVPVQVSAQLPDTYWIGPRSYILLGSDYGERSCEVRSFPDGVQAVTGPRPLRDGSNTVHVLVETQSHFAYRSLTRSPRTTPLSGPHLSAGQQSYFGRIVFDTPWDDDPLPLPIEAGADRVLLPLAYDRGPTGKNTGTLVALVEGGSIGEIFGGQAERILRGTIHWQSGARVIALNASVQLRSRSDILVYRTDGALFVGSAMTGTFNRWDLR